ncbi:hypothetical protein RHSIM_Rhsim03G0023700 [Rhododendron simsii]|uniref:Uncharacterized protein n=1 Tax=Rhododendron simsii TaxID=118357 RepID=A0A834H3Y0_RHOSS|nr:hypothetical protein RHSIM_Rhsim03G0023700 [Rhododendron simsii]
MGKKRRLEICEIEQHSQPSLSHGSPQCTESHEASQPAQPHGSAQTIHLARASHPHYLSGTSRPSNPHSSSCPIQSHCSSQPHEVEGDLDVQANEQRDLVRYWFSEEGKNLSLKNKRGGDKSASVHTAGSKSYARHAYGLEVDSGFAPSRAKLYIPTHTKVDGKPVNDIAGENIEAIKFLMESQPNGWEGNSKGSIFWSRDDIYSQVIPTKKWHGRVPGCGFGPTPKSSSSTCSDSPRFNVADEEERMRDKETIRKLEDKVHAQAVEVSSTLKEQVAKMSTLKEQVAFMMRHMPEFTGLQLLYFCSTTSTNFSAVGCWIVIVLLTSFNVVFVLVAIFAVLMSWSWSVCCCSVMAVVLSELVPVMGSDCYI